MADTPNYQDQLQTLLAPYRELASRLSSPYATINPNSALATNHPFLAHWLDNTTVALANTPQGSTIGENIAAVAHGAMAPEQMRRQRELQSQMLPLQLAMPGIDLQDKLAQIDVRNKQALWDTKRAELADARMDLYTNPKTIGHGMIDAEGNEWQSILNPLDTKRPVRYYNPTSGKYADELPADKQPDFTKQSSVKSHLTDIDIAAGMVGLGPKDSGMTSQDYQAIGSQLQKFRGGVAGSQAGGREAVTNPIELDKGFISEQQKSAQSYLPKNLLTNEQFEAQRADARYTDPKSDILKYKDYTDYYQKTFVPEKQKLDIAFGNYQKYRKQGDRVTFAEWYKANPAAGSPKFIPSDGSNPYNQ